ncbi:MAG: hypothetical protein AAF889_03620 [Cyanobacteria bacterium P01_D01_bin.73]
MQIALLSQTPSRQNQIWDWMNNADNSDTRDEAIKAFADVLGSLFSIPGAVGAALFKVGYTALTKARKNRGELPSN